MFSISLLFHATSFTGGMGEGDLGVYKVSVKVNKQQGDSGLSRVSIFHRRITGSCLREFLGNGKQSRIRREVTLIWGFLLRGIRH